MRLIDADAIADNIAVLLERNQKLIDEWLANIIEDEITEAPTIDAEPVRRGHWVGIDDFPYETWECDQCGYIHEELGGWVPNYCPNCGANCGARMEEQE